MKEGAGEPAQLQAGQFCGREPGELAQLAISCCRGSRDDPGRQDVRLRLAPTGGALCVSVAAGRPLTLLSSALESGITPEGACPGR